ncbi:MAG: ATP-grasp domain-containing protein [Spirochaetota bacterium]
MMLKATELTFLEHIAPRYNIPVPRHIVTAEIHRIKEALETWGGEALVKPDVLSGKRGKAGAIQTVKIANDAVKAIKRISSLEIEGQIPRLAYLVEKVPAQMEMFSAITYNTEYLGPALTISLAGGIDIEEIPENKKLTIPVDIYQGLDAYQAGEVLSKLGCPQNLISVLSRVLIGFWDMFISTGMQSAEINPWRITLDGKVYACDFKATFDESNYKCKIPGMIFPEYPAVVSEFEEEIKRWSDLSYQGQAHVSDLGGKKILPILFGGGASTIIIETLENEGGEPMFLSDFGGNPPYERMYGTAKRCFDYKLKGAELLLILGGKANNTFIDVTFQAIADALVNWVDEHGPLDIPVVIGRGGPRLVKGFLIMKQALEYLKLPYVIFGPETPVTMVAEYAAKLVNAYLRLKENKNEG